SMDGASKFVKAEAIAGNDILIINIIGGHAIGLAQRGMTWLEALQTYTLLTIGDGIVTQIPALVISVGTGIIITRSGSDERLSLEVLNQVTAYPKTLGLVLVALLALLLLPGMPLVPALVVAAVVALLALFATRRRKARDEATKAAEPPAATDEDVYATLGVDALELKVGQNLISLVHGADVQLLERVVAFRKQYALDMGFVAPKLRIRDDTKLDANGYQICAFGVTVASGMLLPERTLAIHPGGERRALQGVATKDPAYGLPAIWVAADELTAARDNGYTLVDPTTVAVTHLSEVIRQNAAMLLTRAETERLLARLRPAHASLLDEVIPTVLSVGEIQKVLQNLLREKVSIRNVEAILEVLADGGRASKDPEQLTELVRQRLGMVICQALANKAGELYVLTLDPAVEHQLATSIRAVDEKTSLVLEPRFAEQVIGRIGGQVERMMKGNVMPVLLTAPELRRHLRRVTERVLPHLSVLSMAEVPNTVSLKAFGSVTL
ncbi:MAG: FHIPEP family type III secretion protein, partial [Rhizobacter sp.]